MIIRKKLVNTVFWCRKQ